MKSKLLILVFLPLFFCSCVSTPKKSKNANNVESSNANYFKDGIYNYSYIYTLESYDLSGGVEYNSKIDKNAYGQAVFIKESKFLEPEFNFSISINEDLSVFSKENNTLFGTAQKDGRIYFSALVEQNGKIYLLTEHCLLLWNGTGEESVYKKYNGKYCLQNYANEQLEFDVSGGVYKGKFNGTINSDGTFYNGYVQTSKTSIEIAGQKMNSYIVIDYKEEGKFIEGGGLQLSSILSTNNGFGKNQTKNVYSSTSVSSIGKETSESLLWNKSSSNIYSSYKPSKNMPAWYDFKIKSDGKYYYVCAMASKDDKETAIQIAKIYALAQYSEMQKTKISSKLKLSVKNKDKQNLEKEFSENSSSFSNTNVPYETVNEDFNEKTKTAYVKIKIKV